MPELSEMIYDRGLRDWELEPAYNATMEDIELGKVKAFIARRSASGRQSGRFKNIERVLVGMRCAVEMSGGTIVPTNAGMLFLGRCRWREAAWFVRLCLFRSFSCSFSPV